MSQQSSLNGDRAHYLFAANDVPIRLDQTTKAEEIAAELLSKGFWAFSAGAPIRARLGPGDRVLIYLAGPGRRYFSVRL